MFQVEHHLLLWLILLPSLAALAAIVARPLLGPRVTAALLPLTAAALLGLVGWLVADLLLIVPDKRRFVTLLLSWVSAPPLHLNVGALFDSLTAVSLAALSTTFALAGWVGARRYRPGDATTFSQLLLLLAATVAVTAGDFLWLYAGWSLSATLAYRVLLSDDDASRRAWRTVWCVGIVADAGLLLAVAVLRKIGGTTDIVAVLFDLLAKAPHIPMEAKIWPARLIVAAVAVRVGLAPLGLWWLRGIGARRLPALLPALAALWVPALYLLGRVSVLLTVAPDALRVLGMLGVAGAVVFALLAWFEDSLARGTLALLLAQIGIAFAAIGSGAFVGGLSALTTLLAGAVALVASAHEVWAAIAATGQADDADDLESMGGLGRRLPGTFVRFGLAVAAVAGVPPFSSFWSLHAELWAALASPLKSVSPGWTIFASLLAAAAAVRLLLRIFYGAFRGRPEVLAGLAGADRPGGRAAVALALLWAAVAGWWTSPSTRVLTPFGHALEWLQLSFRNSTVVLTPKREWLGIWWGEGTFVAFVAAAVFGAAVLTWLAYMIGLEERLPGAGQRQRLVAGLRRGSWVVDVGEALLVRLPFALAAALVALAETTGQALAAALGWLPSRLLFRPRRAADAEEATS